jgi:hypothetical protein
MVKVHDVRVLESQPCHKKAGCTLELAESVTDCPEEYDLVHTVSGPPVGFVQEKLSVPTTVMS